jgi:hypothetical protein
MGNQRPSAVDEDPDLPMSGQRNDARFATVEEEAVARLARLIDEAADLLSRFDEDRWASWLRDDLALIRNGDARGVSHLLRAYGGMGSINDILISPGNGDNVTHREGYELTDHLHALLGKISVVASSLR